MRKLSWDIFEALKAKGAGIENGSVPIIDTVIDAAAARSLHTINITIDEFLANDGELKPDRKIYNEKGDEIGYYLRTEADGLMIMKGANSTFPMSPSAFYVKVTAIINYH